MSTLTRRHFEVLASHLARSRPQHPGAQLGFWTAVTAVASALQEINPRFDRNRFIAAVGVESTLPLLASIPPTDPYVPEPGTEGHPDSLSDRPVQPELLEAV